MYLYSIIISLILLFYHLALSAFMLIKIVYVYIFSLSPELTCLLSVFFVYGESERMHKINYINCRNQLIIHTMYVLHNILCAAHRHHHHRCRRSLSNPAHNLSFVCVSERLSYPIEFFFIAAYVHRYTT